MLKLSDATASAVTSNNYVDEATAGQTVITPGFTWRTSWTGITLFIGGVHQAPGTYTVNSIGGGLSSQVTLPEPLSGGETIDFTTLDISSVPSLQGIIDKLALQSTQVTNAGFGVWSNGTLESAVSSIDLLGGTGNFETDADVAAWTAGNGATLTRDTGNAYLGSSCLKITNSGATVGMACKAFSTVVGRVYKVALQAKAGTAYAWLSIGTAQFLGDIVSGLGVQTSSYGKIEATFEATGTTAHITCANGNVSGGTAYYDSITLYDMGANLVTNGTFNSNTTGWTAYNSPSTFASVAGGINGNCLQITNNGATYGSGNCTAAVVPGKLYKLSAWIRTSSGGTSYLSVGSAELWNYTDLVRLSTSSTSFVNLTAIFEATSEIAYFTLLNNNVSGASGYFDSITLTEVTVGCVDYNTKALDLWTKDNAACCWRETIDTKEGSYYALRVYNGQVYWSDGNRAAKPEFYRKYAGRAATIGMWVKCSSANMARIGITDSAGTTWSSYHSGGGSWEWLEVTRTPGTGITSYNIVVDSGSSTEARFSQPQLQFGASIGSGNFVPIPNEVIRFQTIPSVAYPTSTTALSSFAMKSLNPVTDSNGVIPKGCKSLFIGAHLADSGSASANAASFFANQTGLSSEINSGDTANFGISASGVANGSNQVSTGVVSCAADGRFYIGLNASGTNTAYLRLAYSGVQL